jgi:hypothetical protein
MEKAVKPIGFSHGSVKDGQHKIKLIKQGTTNGS